MKPYRSKLAALVTCLALAACAEQTTDGYLANEAAYEVSFVWHPVNTRAEMLALFKAGGGVYPHDCRPNDRRDTCALAGFAAVDGHGVQHVYTYRPRRVDDDATLTLGHEVMHVALGSYHE